jgi:chemotaxis protein CheD
MNHTAKIGKSRTRHSSETSGSAIAEVEIRGSEEIYLHPGQTFASPEPSSLSMILGSCVGLFLHDRRLHIGGATHFMLPVWDGKGQASSRYGDVAMKTLLDYLQKYGSETRHLQAKVFGGACMFTAFRDGQGMHIGTRNVTATLEFLRATGIAVMYQDTGGESGRKLRIRTDTGDTTVKAVGR